MHQIDIEEITGSPPRLTMAPATRVTSAPGRTSGKDRAAKHRKKMTDTGFVQVNLWLPTSAAADFQHAAERIRKDPDLQIGPLRRTSTGKLEKTK